MLSAAKHLPVVPVMLSGAKHLHVTREILRYRSG